MKLVIDETVNNAVEVEVLQTILQIADFDVGLRQMLEAEQSNTTTAAGNIVLTDSDKVIQIIDPGGSNRDVTLPAEGVDNHGFLIFNSADADEDLIVKDDAGVTLATVYGGGAGWFVSNGVAWKSAGLGTVDPVNVNTGEYVCNGRLTLESGVPASTTDQADKTNLYFTPYNGNWIDIYNTTTTLWDRYKFTELTLAVGGFTASKPYDIFIYDNAGTLTLSGTVWTNATTRATALTTQDGVYVKTGATNFRYLGTIYIDSGQKCQDTTALRYMWNYYNRVNKLLESKDTTNTWSYATLTWRAANANTTDGVGRVSCVIGIAEVLVKADYISISNNTAAALQSGGIGIDSTSENSATIRGGIAIVNTSGIISHVAKYRGYLVAGYHYIQALEISVASGTGTWYGDNNAAVIQSGMQVEMEG